LGHTSPIGSGLAGGGIQMRVRFLQCLAGTAKVVGDNGGPHDGRAGSRPVPADWRHVVTFYAAVHSVWGMMPGHSTAPLRPRRNRKNTMTRPILNEQERSRLDRRIAEAEKATGAQLVLAIVRRCDSYPEIPWKAFAMGVSMATVVLFGLELISSPWVTARSLWPAMATVLCAGGLLALLTVGIPKAARLFLEKNRAEMEVRQYAESLFLDRQLFATRERRSVLLLVSLFERQVVLLPDRGIQNDLDGEAMEKVVSGMTPLLAAGEPAAALEQGLEGLEKILAEKWEGGAFANELADEIIEEKGV